MPRPPAPTSRSCSAPGASLAYLVPGLDVGVAAAGNLSWGLALAGLVLGSLLFPGRRARPRRPSTERPGMSAHASGPSSSSAAFAAFTLISALIAVKGVGEIRELFRHLEGAGGRRRTAARGDR